MNKAHIRNMVLTALLIAFSVIIPTMFGFARVILPPGFTATLASHVPIFIAMFISPVSALCVALGATAGFFLSGLDPVVVMRAASHVVFALIGSYMLKKRMNIVFTGGVTAVLHAVCESFVVLLFIFYPVLGSKIKYDAAVSPYAASFYITGIGTLIHHTIDYIIAICIVFALKKAKLIDALHYK